MIVDIITIAKEIAKIFRLQEIMVRQTYQSKTSDHT